MAENRDAEVRWDKGFTSPKALYQGYGQILAELENVKELIESTDLENINSNLQDVTAQVEGKASEGYMQEVIKRSNIHNVDHLKKWKEKRAKMISENLKAHIGVWGDSITEGFYSEYPPTTAMRQEKGYIGQTHQYYKNNLGDVGLGWCPGYPGTEALNLWKKTGTWTITDLVVTKAAMRTVTAESYAELTFSGTGIEIVFAQRSYGATCEIYIDNTLIRSVNTNTATTPSTTMKETITGLTDGTHVLKIVNKSTGGQNLDIMGAVPIKGNKGVVFYNFSRSGDTSIRLDDASNANNTTGSLTLFPFDISIFAYLTNDAGGNLAQDTYRARLRKYVDTAITSGSEVILIAQGAKAGMTNFHKHVAYRNVMKQVADEKGVCFIDWIGRWRFGDELEKLSNNLYDTDHPNFQGHSDLHNMLIKALEVN
jgi:hypothetical protein